MNIYFLNYTTTCLYLINSDESYYQTLSEADIQLLIGYIRSLKE